MNFLEDKRWLARAALQPPSPRLLPSVIPTLPTPSFLRRQERRIAAPIADTIAGRRSQPPTPHLPSPLKGGRDELGKGVATVEAAQVPACAGMTREAQE